VWFHDEAVLMPAEGGTPEFMEGVMLDITERKRAEAALQAAEAKYRSIVENAVEGIYQTTPDGRVLTANRALARLLGYATPDALGWSMSATSSFRAFRTICARHWQRSPCRLAWCWQTSRDKRHRRCTDSWSTSRSRLSIWRTLSRICSS